MLIKKNPHRWIRDAKLLADRCPVPRGVFGHQDTNGIIKFRLEEIAICNVDESVGESSERLNSFRMLLKAKIKIFALLPKRQLLRIGSSRHDDCHDSFLVTCWHCGNTS